MISLGIILKDDRSKEQTVECDEVIISSGEKIFFYSYIKSAYGNITATKAIHYPVNIEDIHYISITEKEDPRPGGFW